MLTSTKEATTFEALSQKASLMLDSTATTQTKLSHARNQVFHLGAAVGDLCHKLSTTAPLDPYRPPLPKGQVEDQSFPPTLEDHPFWSTMNSNDDTVKAKDEIYNAIGAVFWSLLLLTSVCKIDLRSSILKKMELNAKKYPAHLCRGRSGKYTEYSDATGITETNQSMLDIKIDKDTTDSSPTSVTAPVDSDKIDSKTVPGVTEMIKEFAIDRNWSRYHMPRNIGLAMMGEMGELAEIFQWMGDDNIESEDLDECAKEFDLKEKDFDHLQQEVADVAIYCLRLANVVGIQDLGYVASRQGRNFPDLSKYMNM